MVMDKISSSPNSSFFSLWITIQDLQKLKVFCLWLGFQSHTMKVIPAQACITTDGWMLICILMTSLAEEYTQCSFLLYHIYNFLPSSVTEIFSYDVDAKTLVQHSITNCFRTVLNFILLDQLFSMDKCTTSIFTNHFSITKQTAKPISM